ncbi:MAG TPA: class I SAM-dependent methyltransferase [Longimicrobium sp.]|nr:class I SAM-dependent methyltransferase [Longimicrobium sp.]
MNDHDALELLRAAIPSAAGETWADLGAGSGGFTRALATLVGTGGRVIAVDRDARGLAAIRAWSARWRDGGEIVTMQADVARLPELPPLDGVVIANVLHFVADAEAALRGVAARLRPRGQLVLIEYEGRQPSPWVPYPVSAARFAELAAASGFTPPRVVATRPSAYGGELYVAAAERPG